MAWVNYKDSPKKLTVFDSIYNDHNPYNYRINVNHPIVLPIYEKYKSELNRGLSDKDRAIFEQQFEEWYKCDIELNRLLREGSEQEVIEYVKKAAKTDKNHSQNMER